MQVLRHEELSAIAQQNTFHETSLEPRRGDILDVRGNVLATSAFVKTVCANPSLIGSHAPEIAHALAPLLQKEEAWLIERLTRTHKNDKGEIVSAMGVPLKQKVPPETWQKIQTAPWSPAALG